MSDNQPHYLAQGYEGSHKLRGLAALVTGGDSGIGRAVAVLYAREGADVAIVYHSDQDDAKETARLVEAEGGKSLVMGGDVRDPAFCRQAVEQTVEAFGRLDVLVNNAAFQHRSESLTEIKDEDFDNTWRTNVGGYLYMARAALPHLKKGAAIINTGSLAGLDGNEDLLDYAATKGAIHAFTKSLARNLADKGIRVNAIAPGPVWTPMNPTAGYEDNSDIERAAHPDELSPAYVFLASSACSSYITGIVLPVTGRVGAI